MDGTNQEMHPYQFVCCMRANGAPRVVLVLQLSLPVNIKRGRF